MTPPLSSHTPRPARRAFTLVEVTVAAVILALVAAATAGAIGQTARLRDRAAARALAFTRAQAAANRFAADLENTLREGDLYHARLAITTGGAPGREADGLLLLTNLTRPVRAGDDQPEGREAEVQYRLQTEAATPGRPAPVASTLWRRADPGIDEYLDAGGVASAVIEGLQALSITATDGESWYETWDSDADGYPHAVRLLVVASDDDGRYTAAARRTIAFDRTPLPVEEAAEEEEEEDQPDGATGSGGTSTGGGTSGGNPGNTGGAANPGSTPRPNASPTGGRP